MTKQEIIDKFSISSKFNTVVKSDYNLPNYKFDHYMLCPRYNISINNKSYQYHQSAQFLKENILKQKNIHWKIGIPNDIDKLQFTTFCSSEDNLLELEYRKTSNHKIYNTQNHIQILNPLLPKQLSNDDNLFAFRAIIESALFFIKYTMDDFLENFGYIDNIESIRKGENIYRQCEQIYRKLGLSECNIQELLDNLSKLSVE